MNRPAKTDETVRSLPRLLITLGDPAGGGPEVVARVLVDPALRDRCRATVVGDRKLLERALDLIGKRAEVDVDPIGPLGDQPDLADRGRYLHHAILRGLTQCLDGQADALVTAPISKAALQAASCPHPGHTELLGELCNAQPVMMLIGGPLRVVPLTTHCALREVPDRLNLEKVAQVGRIVDRSLRYDFGKNSPKIALAGLNPHAGEGGMFGTEEIDILSPAVRRLRQQRLDITGPLPADTVFYRAAQGEFDAVIAPTHDQALIPVKLLAFTTCVNITLNLPIVRTSPGHGTAEDVAWTGRADESGMRAAIETAIAMADQRRKG